MSQGETSLEVIPSDMQGMRPKHSRQECQRKDETTDKGQTQADR
jgi:hypothetical protein